MTDVAVPADVVAEVQVAGRHVDLGASGPECQHRTFTAEVVTANVTDPDGAVLRRDARLRLRCGECGVPCVIDHQGREPADGLGHGVTLTFRPMAEHPTAATDSLPTMAATSA